MDVSARTQPPTALVVAALAAVYVVWGSTYLAIRVGVETLPPFLMGGSRFVLAGGLLLAWTVWRGDLALGPGGRPDAVRLGPPQWRAAAIVGGLLLLGGNGLVSWGEQTVPSGLAALLVSSTPLWLALLSRMLFRELLSTMALAGVVLGFVGVALLVRPSGSGAGWAGIAAVLVAAFLWGLGSVLSQRLPLPSRPLVATGLEMVCGGALMLTVSVLLGEPGRLDLAAVAPEAWWALAYLIVFGSMVAFTAYVWLLANVRTDLAGTYAYVNPLVAVLLGWALLREPVGPEVLVGGGIVVLSVALVVLGRSRSAPGGVPGSIHGQTDRARSPEAAAIDRGDPA